MRAVFPALFAAAVLLEEGGRAVAVEPDELPAGRGREETYYTCSACHSFSLVAQQGMSWGDWEEIIDWMIEEQGMSDLESEERALILEYLSKNFGPDRPFWSQSRE